MTKMEILTFATGAMIFKMTNLCIGLRIAYKCWAVSMPRAQDNRTCSFIFFPEPIKAKYSGSTYTLGPDFQSLVFLRLFNVGL